MKKTALLFGLAILLISSSAGAVPATMNFAGRLSTAAGPVDGAVSVTFRLFDAPTGGSAGWTESVNLTADNGLIYAVLGMSRPLDETVFTGDARFLEIAIGAETLTPRLPIGSIPYSVRSSSADSADLLGTLSPSDVVTQVNAGAGLNGGGSGGVVNVAVNTTQIQSRVTGTCAAGSSIRVIAQDGSVTCEPDDAGGSLACSNVAVTDSAPAGGQSFTTATCGAGDIMTGGGCDTTGGPGISSRELFESYPSANGWNCAYYNSGTVAMGVTAYARCCRLN